MAPARGKTLYPCVVPNYILLMAASGRIIKYVFLATGMCFMRYANKKELLCQKQNPKY